MNAAAEIDAATCAATDAATRAETTEDTGLLATAIWADVADVTRGAVRVTREAMKDLS